MPKTKRMFLVVVIAAAAVVAVAVGLLETVFFHVNPVKLGFHRFDYGRYVVLTKGAAPDSQYETLSETMLQNELAVALSYKSKVQIIVCERQSDINRYLPFVNGSSRRNAVGFAQWPNTIYITPGMKEKYGTAQGTLGHELSHILLIQNFGIIRATLLWKRAEWIPEGFAAYLNNWPRYFARTQLTQKLKDAGITFHNNQFPAGDHLSMLPLPLRYMIHRYFVEYLYERKSPTTVVRFLKEACSDPFDVEGVFKQEFSDSLNDYWKGFYASIVPENAD